MYLISCCSIVKDLAEALFRVPRSPRFARPCYYSTSLSACQGVFQKFFQKLFPSLPLSQRCFESIPHPLSFVKRFSESFSLFSRFLSVVSPPSFGQPRYYTTPLPFCQHFFVEFLRFGDSVKAHKCLSGFLGRVHKQGRVLFVATTPLYIM